MIYSLSYFGLPKSNDLGKFCLKYKIYKYMQFSISWRQRDSKHYGREEVDWNSSLLIKTCVFFTGI